MICENPEEITHNIVWEDEFQNYIDCANKIIADMEAQNQVDDMSEKQLLAGGVQRMADLLINYGKDISMYREKYIDMFDKYETLKSKLNDKILDMQEVRNLAKSRNMNSSAEAFGIAISHLEDLYKEVLL